VESIIDIGKQEITKNLVICSNVNPGYSDAVAEKISKLNWTVSYNPECIAQGTILHNQANPDVVVIGEASESIGNKLETIYRNITINSFELCRMSRVEAELSKMSLNCYLTVKISFANFVGDLAKKLGGSPDKILNAVGKDTRIGNKYFNYGFGYGGPCFPRDNRALVYTANENGMEAILSEAADISNRRHLLFQVQEFSSDRPKCDPVVFTSVTYKEGVTIIEESQQLAFAHELAKRGYDVVIEEGPEVIEKVKKDYGEVFAYVER
jgi:nucleotide sugar dehydrogenase